MWLRVSAFGVVLFFVLLSDAVLSDWAPGYMRGRKHIIGLSSSTLSLAYVIGPILAGWLSGTFGEVETFAIIGWGVVVIAGILLIVTPKKLRLPQEEIQSWE